MKVEIVSTDEFAQVYKMLEQLDLRLQKIDLINQEAKLYTNKEMCQLLNVSTKTLQTYRDNGIIQYNQINRKILYTEKALQLFLEAHKVKRNN